MKICPKCQSNNEDAVNFCIKCGTDLRNLNSPQPQEVPEAVPPQSTPPAVVVQGPTEPEPVSQKPTAPVSVSQEPTAPSTTPTLDSIPAPVLPPKSDTVNTPPSKKAFSLKSVIIIGALLVVVIYAIYALISSSNPANRLLKGFTALSKNSAQTVNSTVTLKYKGDNDQLKLMNNASIKMSTAMDTTKMRAESSFEILYDNKSVAKFNAGLGSEDVFLDLLKLYSKDLYYQLDDTTIGIISELQVLYKYLKQVDIKYNTGKYAKVIDDVLGDNITGSLNKVTFTIDSKTSIELLIAVLKEAQDDEQLKESIRKNAQSVITKILNDKHTFEVLFDEEMLTDVQDYVKNKDDFADLYQTAIDGAISTLEGLQQNMKDYPEYYQSISKMEYTVTYGMFQKIKGITCSMTVDIPNTGETIKVMVDAKVRNGAGLTNFKRSGAVDVMDLVSDPVKAQSIAKKVISSVVSNIKGNKKLTTAIEDITGQDINDLSDYVLQGLAGGF